MTATAAKRVQLTRRRYFIAAEMVNTIPGSAGDLVNAFERIAIGDQGEATTVVTLDITVRERLSWMPAVYATPHMIYLMELAASNAIEGRLPDGWVTVGVEVKVRHLAATPVGRTVVAKAKVSALARRLITFEVEAHDGVHRIGKGTHSRSPVELKRFE